jgi:hypothetical protein
MRITLMKDRASHILKELGDKCIVTDTELQFVTIEIFEVNPQTLLSLFHAGVNSGFAAGIEAVERQLNKAGFSNY